MAKMYVIGVLFVLYLFWFYRNLLPTQTAYVKKHALQAMGTGKLPADWNRNKRTLQLNILFALIAWVYLVGLLIYYLFFT